jgi:hypothetical protein
MSLTLIASLSATGLLFGMIIFLEVGRRIGMARLVRDPEGLMKGVGAVEGAAFGLLGLLIAFTFSGGAENATFQTQIINLGLKSEAISKGNFPLDHPMRTRLRLK